MFTYNFFKYITMQILSKNVKVYIRINNFDIFVKMMKINPGHTHRVQ